MRDHDDGAVPEALLERRLTAGDKARVARADGFVDQVDVELERDADAEPQPRRHAAGIGLDRLVEIGAQLGEGLDELDDFPDVEPVDPRDERGVLPPGHIAGEAALIAKRKRDMGIARDAPAFRQLDAADEAQQSRLPGTVEAENADILARVEDDVETLQHDLAAEPGRVAFMHVLKNDHRRRQYYPKRTREHTIDGNGLIGLITAQRFKNKNPGPGRIDGIAFALRPSGNRRHRRCVPGRDRRGTWRPAAGAGRDRGRQDAAPSAYLDRRVPRLRGTPGRGGAIAGTRRA